MKNPFEDTSSLTSDVRLHEVVQSPELARMIQELRETEEKNPAMLRALEMSPEEWERLDHDVLNSAGLPATCFREPNDPESARTALEEYLATSQGSAEYKAAAKELQKELR